MLARLLLAALLTAVPQAAEDEAALRALAERFIATQEQGDPDAHLALWSLDAPDAARRREYMAMVFREGRDRFLNLRIDRVAMAGDRATLRVAVDRERTIGADYAVIKSQYASVLECVRTADGWRLFRETPAFVALADALLDEPDPAKRTAMIERDRDLVGPDFLRALGNRLDRFAVARQAEPALRTYDILVHAARMVGDRETLARAEQNAGNIHYFAGNFQRALEHYRDRLSLEETRGDRESIAQAHQAIATALYAIADYAGALDSYRRALSIEETLERPANLVALTTSLGNVYFVQGDYAGAIESFARSRRLADAGEDSFGAARALHSEGRAESARGNYAAAIASIEQALARFRTAQAREATASALSSLAHVRYLRGEHDASIALYQDCLAIEQAANNGAGIARVLQAMGLIELVRGRYAAAVEAYSRSRGEYDKLRDRTGRAQATLGLGFAQTALGKIDDALASYRTALGEFEALGRREEVGRTSLGLAIAHAARRAAADSLEAAIRAGTIGREVGSRDLEWRARVREGYALLALQKLADARSAFEAGVAVVEAPDDQPVGEQGPEPAGDDRASPHVGLAEALAAAGDARGALVAAERARLRRLRDELARVRGAIHRGMTGAERDEERRLARNVVSLGAQIGRQTRMPKPDPDRLAALRDGLARAVREREAFAAALYERLPELRRWRGDLPAAELEAVVSPSDRPPAALVSYVISEDRLIAFVARGSTEPRVTATVLPSSATDLHAHASKALTPEALKDPVVWRAAARSLYDALIAPIRAALDGHTAVILVPDGFLWRVPFEALESADGRILLDDFAISYAGSMTALAEARRLPAPSGITIAALSAAAGRLDVASPFYSTVTLEPPGVTAPVEFRELFASAIDARLVLLAALTVPRDRLSLGDAAHAAGWAWAAAGVRGIFLPRWDAGDDPGAAAFVGRIRDRMAAGVATASPAAALREAIAEARNSTPPWVWARLLPICDP
jgi:tetratricopeptide (TPR) repeat protein